MAAVVEVGPAGEQHVTAVFASGENGVERYVAAPRAAPAEPAADQHLITADGVFAAAPGDVAASKTGADLAGMDAVLEPGAADEEGLAARCVLPARPNGAARHMAAVRPDPLRLGDGRDRQSEERGCEQCEEWNGEAHDQSRVLRIVAEKPSAGLADCHLWVVGSAAAI